MYGNNKFKWLSGREFKAIGICSTSGLALADSDSNHPTAVLEIGLMVDAVLSTKVLSIVNGKATGFLSQRVSLNGITDNQGFRDFSIGKLDLPVKKGAPVSIHIPDPNTYAEFEGLGASSIGNFVITATDTGALQTNTARGTALSVKKGGWYIAQPGDMCLAHLETASITPVTSGNRRICVKFVSPYQIPSA